MKLGTRVAWDSLARVVGVASLCSILHFAYAADPAIKLLRVIALDSAARVAVVKLDENKPQTWRVGEALALGTQHALLRECAGGHAIVEITARPATAPTTVLIAPGETYRLDIDRAPARAVGVSVAPSQIQHR